MQVLQLRGGLVETSHAVSAVARGFEADQAGAVLWQTGQDTHSTWRSAAKPLQLWCCLEALGDPHNLSATQLALGSSSHSGQEGHVQAVRELLAHFGFDEAALRCGAEPPAHRPTAAALVAAGRPSLAVHNDCSGKHTMMLGACRAQGWPSDDYLAADHPLHQRIVQVAHAWSGQLPRLAVDGCGAPTLWLTLSAMAAVWARLAAATDDAAVDARLHRIGTALADHPWWTSGDDRLDLALHQRAAEPWIGKIGARGVFCIALPARRLAVAVKVHDGDEDALAVAVPAVLEQVAPGALSPSCHWPWATIHNVVGRAVGTRVAVGSHGV